jgi:isopenicillin N synthase-like dioxygenase
MSRSTKLSWTTVTRSGKQPVILRTRWNQQGFFGTSTAANMTTAPTSSSVIPAKPHSTTSFKSSVPPFRQSEKSSSVVIPIVDLALPLDQVGRQIHKACTTVGFFYVANHGVSETLCTTVLEQARYMFTHLTETEKDDISVANSNSYRGYQRMGVNVTKNVRDGHEALDLVSESKAAQRNNTTNNNHHGLTNYGYNQWPNPQRFPDLRPTIEQYITEMNRTGKQLADATSIGLGLHENFFQPYFTDAYWSMRLIRYPSSRGGDTNNLQQDYQYGVGEHTDYGVFTMILCDNVPNTLQIRPKYGGGGKSSSSSSSGWQFVDPIPGTFICSK